jgi:hypothetical protein
MCFFKKNTKPAEKNQEDRDLIETASGLVGTLIVQAEGDEELVEKLKNLQEKVKYMTPSTDAKILGYDKKIQNKITDFKVVMLKKTGTERVKAVDDFVRDVNMLVEERNAYWK